MFDYIFNILPLEYPVGYWIWGYVFACLAIHSVWKYMGPVCREAYGEEFMHWMTIIISFFVFAGFAYVVYVYWVHPQGILRPLVMWFLRG